MKLCKECHKLSRDDDFCSHCGAAVFGLDDVTDLSVNCDRIHGHDHRKQSYTDGSRSPLLGRKEPEYTRKTKTAVAIAIIIIAVLPFLRFSLVFFDLMAEYFGSLF